MWELDCKESWAPKYWCFWAVVLEKTLESPLNSKEIQPVSPIELSWMFIGWSQGRNWIWHIVLRISWLTQGLPTPSWPSTLESSPSKPVPFWVLQEKQLQKDSPKNSFFVGMNKYCPTSFWWSLSVLLPYWEQIFPCFWNLAAIAFLLEDALKLSLVGKLIFYQPPRWLERSFRGTGHQMTLRQVVSFCPLAN